MRWNCPHCGINLAVSDEKLGSGWSFSRCYKCAGFALVRRSDVNLIKVDRAPVGEQVLLPEASEEPTSMLSQNATKNLTRYLDNNRITEMNNSRANAAAEAALASIQVERPVIRTANRKGSIFSKRSESAPQSATQPQLTAPKTSQSNNVQAAQPNQQANKAALPPQFNFGFGAHALPDPLPEHPLHGARAKLLPAAIGLASLMAISSGIYLFVQGQALWEKARTQAPETAATGKTIANSNKQAMLDTANESPNNEVIRAPTLTGTNNETLASAATHVEMTSDEVHSNAMAPAREVEPDAQSTSMRIRIKVKSANIHSGPGLDYPTIGALLQHGVHPVAEWKDRWFKIILNPSDPASNKTAWIRNDLVSTVQ